jgi:hypothetical protein
LSRNSELRLRSANRAPITFPACIREAINTEHQNAVSVDSFTLPACHRWNHRLRKNQHVRQFRRRSQEGRGEQNQPHTEEEARQAIKEFYTRYVGGDKEVQVVSISKPIEPSPKYLATKPGATAYYVIYETREPKLTSKWPVLVTVRRMTFGPNKGKLLLASSWTIESEIGEMMGADWLRDHPVPWKVAGKK